MDTKVTSNLLTQMEAWIASADGQRYACTRQYPHPDYACDHDAKCVGCLMVSAALELRKGYETKSPHCINCHCGEAVQGMVARADYQDFHAGLMAVVYESKSHSEAVRFASDALQHKASAEKAKLPQAAVAGDVMTMTLAQFHVRGQHLLIEEQEKPDPDNALVSFICEAIRLAREYERGRALAENGRPQS